MDQVNVYHQPLRYGFEAILTNEFHTLNGTCSSLVPQGAGYENVSLANQVCTTVGSIPGQDFVDGNTFVELSYAYSYSHLWRVSLDNLQYSQRETVLTHHHYLSRILGFSSHSPFSSSSFLIFSRRSTPLPRGRVQSPYLSEEQMRLSRNPLLPTRKSLVHIPEPPSQRSPPKKWKML